MGAGLIPILVYIAIMNRRQRLSPGQCVTLALGAAALEYSILYPPMIGGGPLGVHFGTGFLFHHSRETFINTRTLDFQALELTMITFAATWLVRLVNKRRAPVQSAGEGHA